MKDQPEPSNPMNQPKDQRQDQPAGSDGSPRFGRLLIVLAIAVAIMVFVTWASQAWLAP